MIFMEVCCMSSTTRHACSYCIMELECIPSGEDTFTGEFRQVFESTGAYGGENIALAAKAALMTIEDRKKYLINSVHCYYVRAGKKGQVSYHVSRVKDGQTFCFRSVVGTQDSNKPIITCLVSFKSIQTNYLSHNKYPMPLTGQELDESLSALSNTSIFDFDVAHHFENLIDLEVKHWKVMPFWYMPKGKESQEPRQMTWMKPCSPIHSTADQNDHRLAILYASDYHVDQMILYKYPEYQTSFHTSLDHSVHFCSNHIDFNEWHLCCMECVSFDDGVTSNKSRIYSHGGDLIACVTQQGYVKIKAKL